MYKLRTATIDDVNTIVANVGIDMFSLMGVADKYDADSLSLVIAQLVSNITIVEDNSVIVGVMCAMATPFLWNPKITVYSELFWWVKETHRGTRVGAMLLFDFEKCGKEVGAKYLNISTMPSTEVSLEKRGYVLKEKCMVKGV